MTGERLPDGLSPRLLSADQAAAYCGMSRNHFAQHVAPFVPPIPNIGARRLWDLRALDRWLDARSGLAHAQPQKLKLLEALDGDQNDRRQTRPQ